MKKEITIMPSPTYPGWPNYTKESQQEAHALAQLFTDVANELALSVPELEEKQKTLRRICYVKTY